MNRYCNNCQQSFDFKISKMSDFDNLICPVCGNKIEKNSRKPVNPQIKENEEKLGRAFGKMFYIAYIFYLICGIVGMVSYFIGANKVLYVVTAISIIVFLIQYFAGVLTFETGFIFIPVGLIAGYLYFRTLEGACLGVMIVYILRHIIRDLFYGLLWKLVRYGRDAD